MNSSFHIIDFEAWPRRQYFYYFTKMLPTGFNLNVEIDVTTTYKMLKSQGKKFFPAYLYLTTKLINKDPNYSYMVGVIPWISFKSYSPVPFGFGESTNFFPILEAGKFYEKDNRLFMPLSMTVHHAVVDGYQVSSFFKELQREMNHPENWINNKKIV